MMKYIFVTGGVVSGLGKGITAASLGVQYHPKFKSRPNNPHPLFLGFIGAALKRQGEKDI